MIRLFNIKISLVLLCLLVLNFWSCTNDEKDIVFDNPLDQTGTTWSLPTIVAMGDVDVAIKDSVAVTVVSSDSLGDVAKLIWKCSFPTDSLETERDTLKRFYNYSGVDTILVWGVNDRGIVSVIPDTILINIHEYAPVVDSLKDTVYSINDSLAITISAQDTNGTIFTYLYSINSDTLWHENLTDSTLHFLFDTAAVYTIGYKVYDDDSIESNVMSFTIDIHEFRPTISVKDPLHVVTRDEDILMEVSGNDTNGVIIGYEWQFGDEIPLYIDSTGTTFDTSFSDSGMYVISVRSIDDDSLFSNYDTIRVAVKVNSVLPYFPLDGSSNIKKEITLEWVPGFYSDSFAVYFGNNSNLTSTDLLGVTTNNTYLISDTLSFNTQYFWKIAAYNSLKDSAISSVWSFTTEVFQYVNLLEPQNLASLTDTSVTLKWSGGTYSESYSVYCDTNPNPVTLIASNSNDTTVSVELSYGKTFYWKVNEDVE